MRSLRRVGLGLALTGIWAMSAAPMLAADNGTVDATVTVATPCIEVNELPVDFGSLSFTRSDGTPVVGNAPVSYSNCATVTEFIFARGTDATGAGAPVTWTLNESFQGGLCPGIGPNVYGLALHDGAGTEEFLSTTDAAIDPIGAGEAGNLNALALVMPCAGSDGGGAVMSFQVVFTATF